MRDEEEPKEALITFSFTGGFEVASWEADERKVWGLLLDLKRRVRELEEKVNVGQATEKNESLQDNKKQASP